MLFTETGGIRGTFRDIRFSYLDKIEVSGAQEDLLASSLSGWWVFLGAILYRRQVVAEVGGWDETLRAAQDSDFFRTIVLSGAKVRYQAGSHSFYRQYGAVTVSSSNLNRWVENHYNSLQKSETCVKACRSIDRQIPLSPCIRVFCTSARDHLLYSRGTPLVCTLCQITCRSPMQGIGAMSPFSRRRRNTSFCRARTDVGIQLRNALPFLGSL